MRHHAGALEHPRRRLLYIYIRNHPGASFREVARQVGVATGTARHHLTVLKRRQLIVEHPYQSTTRFFENHGRYDATWQQIALLREPALRLLFDWVAQHPHSPQKDILNGMAERHGWPRSTTQHRIQRLTLAGALCMNFQGRLKKYSICFPPLRRK